MTVKVAPHTECFAISYNNGCIRNLNDSLGQLFGTKLVNQPDMLRNAPQLSTRKYYYYYIYIYIYKCVCACMRANFEQKTEQNEKINVQYLN